MSYRRVTATVAALTVLLSGCGSDTGDSGATAEAAQPNTLDATSCAELTDAKLNLAVATDAEQAQAAADVFGKYDPPADTVEAIDTVVAAGGVKFDGSDFDMINDHIDSWVREVCPG